jgi:hypothetical protein
MKEPNVYYKVLVWFELDEKEDTPDFAPESGWKLQSYSITRSGAKQIARDFPKSKIIQVIEQELE